MLFIRYPGGRHRRLLASGGVHGFSPTPANVPDGLPSWGDVVGTGGGSDLADLMIVLVWPECWRSGSPASPGGRRPLVGELARRVKTMVLAWQFGGAGSATSSFWSDADGARDRAAVGLARLAGRGAHVLVVSTLDIDELAAEMRDSGLLRHVHGVAGGVQNITAYLMDHRCRRDRAIFVGHRERDVAIAVRVGYEVGVGAR